MHYHYLYYLNERYSLLMVAPTEWNKNFKGKFLASCKMHEDLTWSMKLSPSAQNNKNFMSEVQQALNKFNENLEECKKLKDILPYHDHTLSYHQRILAYALSNSLKASMDLSQISELNYKESLKLLT